LVTVRATLNGYNFAFDEVKVTVADSPAQASIRLRRLPYCSDIDAIGNIDGGIVLDGVNRGGWFDFSPVEFGYIATDHWKTMTIRNFREDSVTIGVSHSVSTNFTITGITTPVSLGSDGSLDFTIGPQGGLGNNSTHSTTVTITADGEPIITFPVNFTVGSPPTYTVTFNTHQGTPVQTLYNVRSGSMIPEPIVTGPRYTYQPRLYIGTFNPALPVNHNLDHWFWVEDGVGNQTFNFTTNTITSNLNLQAQWVAPYGHVDPVTVPQNDIAAAFNHANTVAFLTTSYTLLLNNTSPITVDGGELSLNQTNANLTIHSLGSGNRTINLSSTNGPILTVGDYTGTATNMMLAIGNNIMLQGRSGNNNAVVAVNSGGFFLMEGGQISGNSSSDRGGGGVSVNGDGIFVMDGGIISGNTSDLGGGVYVTDTGRFYMYGGTITNNTGTPAVDFAGGGVYLDGADAEFFKTYIVTTGRGGIINGNTGTPGANAIFWSRSPASLQHNGPLLANEEINTADDSTPPWQVVP
jgi:hypothetical protein